MPHHSKQPAPYNGNNSINARHSFPPPSNGNLMMLSTTIQQQQQPPDSTWPPPHSQHHSTTRTSPAQQPHFHRVPQSPAEVTKPIINAPSSKDSSEDVLYASRHHHHDQHDRELAASVLLLVAAANTENSSARTEQATRPLKKRCLSPMSPAHSTATCTTAASTPQRSDTRVIVDSQASSRTMSYDEVKDHNEDNEDDDHEDEDDEPQDTGSNSKISHITAGTINDMQNKKSAILIDNNAMVHSNNNKNKSMPSMLYWLLTDTTSEQTSYIRTILQWLPHGQAWKIVRIDGLRRLIIPQFFTECLLEDGTSSVDAFLLHLRAWGFEEIRDGPDIGAFAHTRFRRGYPQLCREMTFTSPLQDPHQRDAALLLRVPSLTSNESKDITTSPQQSFYGSTPPVFVNYRSEDVMRGRPYHSPIRSARGAHRQNPTVSTRGRRKPDVKRKLPMTQQQPAES